jgi:hypothetical protein
MYPDHLPLSERLKEAHAEALEVMASPGPSWSGTDRLQMVGEARAALNCPLCATRRTALSPNAHQGSHVGPSDLDPVVVDAIHRIRTDPARLTRTVFDAVTAVIEPAAYIELVSVVASSVIVDTLHRALGLAVPALPDAVPGEPTRDAPGDTVDEGAWVPIMRVPERPGPGAPAVWNIARSMGLVPTAVNLFFSTFRPHYALTDIDLSISQSQAEFVAARVSAMNECFY